MSCGKVLRHRLVFTRDRRFAKGPTFAGSREESKPHSVRSPNGMGPNTEHASERSTFLQPAFENVRSTGSRDSFYEENG